MRLSKLEMQGFKSFADITTMVYDNGVTAIVGPNGCGKSNVSDAVRWVLGEQRARMLRGAKMEEVIFQGSSARRAVNLAEVSLYFENDDGGLPIPFREVVITRRLSRSGESEYLLNGASCRLRDIHDMLRGTGLGSDAGVIIEAKMIDALLSDRPDDRRELFEEASGVGLYRDRRRSTERRLEETATDLARLDDLLSEVQSQVRSLARQRKKTERGAELTQRRFGAELTLASREMSKWHEELGGLEGRLTELRNAGPVDQAAVTNAEQAREAAHQNRAQAEVNRDELGRLAAQQQSSVQELRAELAVAEERQRNALERRQRAEYEQKESTAVGERLTAERDRARSDLDALQADVEEAQVALTAAAAAEELARRAVTDKRSAVEAVEREARQLRDRDRRLELERESSQREIGDLDTRLTQLATEREALEDAALSLRRQVEDADAALAQAHEAVAGTATVLEAARAGAQESRTEEAAARAEAARCEELLTSLEGKVNALEGLERERVGLAPAAARLLREKERFGDAILGPLSDFLTASADSASLVERFLGMTVHAVVVRDRATADEIRRWHAEENPGPLLLLPLDSVTAQSTENSGDLVGQIDVVPSVTRWVNTLLAKVQTLDGGAAFVDARGALWLPGSTAGPGPLRRRADLFALRAELTAADDARAAASDAADAARVKLNAAEDAVRLASEEFASTEQQHRRAQEGRAELERQRQRGLREIHDADALAARLSARREELVSRIADMQSQSDAIRVELTTADATTEELRAEAVASDHQLEHSRDQRTAAQVAVAQVHARVQVATDRMARLDSEFASASQRLTQLHDELSHLGASDRQLAEQLADWRNTLEARTATLRDAEGRLGDATAALRAADDHLAQIDGELVDARRAAHERETALHQAELRFIELSGKRTAIRERLETEWRRPLEDLLATYVPVEMDDDTLRIEVEGLRAEVEKLGPVNPLAIEEHDEELKRFDFITSQRNDLVDARNKLQLAIREIDSTARDLFLATFTQVRENFREIFMTLFGGGECDLRLENPDAPLDCDIEIHASPRGKRTQRIHLLSSGERALVALSLLFGIFRTKPSPFCLLDEVDAPLDDANIGRFVHMLTQFKKSTQFIVITHNPRTTTEAADAVYGVTMQEPGVSSLVSVRMRGRDVDEGQPVAAIGAPETAEATT